MHGGKPWLTEYDNPFVQAAGRAIEQGFGKTPVFCREGGSIPVVSTFQEELGVPAVLFGVGLPDENAHAPNEKIDLGNFHGGVISAAILYDEIAKTRAGVMTPDLLARLARHRDQLSLRCAPGDSRAGPGHSSDRRRASGWPARRVPCRAATTFWVCSKRCARRSPAKCSSWTPGPNAWLSPASCLRPRRSAKGLAGIVVDGAVRDVATIRALGLPVYARSISPAAGTVSALAAFNQPIQCGGVEIVQGDIVIGDDDGIVVLTEDELRELLPIAEEIQAKESHALARMAEGQSLFDLINLDEHVAALEAGRPSRFRVQELVTRPSTGRKTTCRKRR